MSELNFNTPFDPFTPTANNFLNLTGQQFTRLTVYSIYGKTPLGQVLWLCRCNCGNWLVKTLGDLRSGNSRSCGCLRAEITNARFTTHGESAGERSSTEYNAYASARSRCQCKTDKVFPYYGGRGIEFRFNSFEEFFAEVGRKPTPKHTLDRFPNNKTGHYEKGNVRWATRREQARNKRNNRWITINGETLCLTDWCKKYHLHISTVLRRCKRGWNIIQAITTPLRSRQSLPLAPEQTS